MIIFKIYLLLNNRVTFNNHKKHYENLMIFSWSLFNKFLLIFKIIFIMEII